MATLVGACSTLICSVLPATASWRGPCTAEAGITTTTCRVVNTSKKCRRAARWSLTGAGANRFMSPSR